MYVFLQISCRIGVCVFISCVCVFKNIILHWCVSLRVMRVCVFGVCVLVWYVCLYLKPLMCALIFHSPSSPTVCVCVCVCMYARGLLCHDKKVEMRMHTYMHPYKHLCRIIHIHIHTQTHKRAETAQFLQM